MIDKHELAQLLTDATEATLDWREALAGVADALREEGDKPMPDLWAGPFDWHGSECPLPPDVIVTQGFERGDPITYPAKCLVWGNRSCPVTAFSYLADEPGGWVKRPEGWTPPDSAYPLAVRLDHGGDYILHEPRYFGVEEPVSIVTHIRLVQRASTPELPEWVEPPIIGGQDWRVRQSDGYWWRIPRDDIARIGDLHEILKARGE